MYAIVEIAGQQFKVERGNKVYVHRLEANEGDKVEFTHVLLTDNNGKVTVGNPTVDGARVAATILGHLKGDKVIVFKKKRRKGYQKWNNHRQSYTQVLIQGVLGKGEKLTDELEAKPRVAREHNRRLKPVSAPVAVEAQQEEAAPAKKAPAKKAAPKKAAAKKAAKKKED